MRVGENLPPLLQNLTFVLLVLAYSLCFVTAISALWGWRAVGLAQCAVLVVLVIDERNAIRRALVNDTAGKPDRLFAWYKLTLVSIAVLVNVILGGLWLAGIHR